MDAREERARRAGEGAASRVVRSGAQGKRPTRGGEKVRERAGVAGEERARQISGLGDRTVEHTGKRRRRYGRAGVHTGNAWKQTRRQRFGVAGRKTSERARLTGT